MRISNTEIRLFTALTLIISFIGFVTLGYKNLANIYNAIPIIFFLGGIISLIYDINQISICHFPMLLQWDELDGEYVISPTTKSEKYGLLRIFLKKPGFLKIMLSEIIINTPDYFKMSVQVGAPTSQIIEKKSFDRSIYYIPMKKDVRKGYFIGIDFRVKNNLGDNIYNDEIDVTVKYDLNLKSRKILSCKKTINI